MADNNLPAPAGPVDTTPETYDEQVEGLADLLDDPDESPDLPEDQGHDAAVADPEDPDAIIAEDADASEGTTEDDGPQEDYSGGRFAADDAKIRMDDGRVISVRDLKSHVDTRAKELQRGFTEKTTELKVRKDEVDQQAQSLSETSQYLDWYAQHYLPKAPEPPVDPNNYVARIDYLTAKENWDKEQQLRTYFREQTQALSQQKQREMDEARNKRVGDEINALVGKDPLFRDSAKATAWMQRAQALGGEYYGFSPEEIAGTLSDHRLVLALRDAFRFRMQKAKAATVREEVKKPVIATGGRRADPKATASKEKQARSERLRRDPTFENGVASLMDFDL